MAHDVKVARQALQRLVDAHNALAAADVPLTVRITDIVLGVVGDYIGQPVDPPVWYCYSTPEWGKSFADGPGIYLKPASYPPDITEAEIAAICYGAMAAYYQRRAEERARLSRRDGDALLLGGLDILRGVERVSEESAP